MPSGGKREGAGRRPRGESNFTKKMRKNLHELQDKFEEPLGPLKVMRPEEILLLVSNGLPPPGPGKRQWTPAMLQAAVALLPYSIAKPASVQIHHVSRTDARQYTDEELRRIIDEDASGSGTFAASESPLFPVGLVQRSIGADGTSASEAPSLADLGIGEAMEDP